MRLHDVLYASRRELTPWSSIEVVITGTTGNRVYPKRVPRVQIPPAPPSKGYKKDVAQETPDFIGGFAVSTAEKTTSDFVDVKKILFPF